MPIIHSGYTQKHEYNSFGRAGHHFQRILYGGVRFLRYIQFNVIFHRNTTKCDSVKTGRIQRNILIAGHISFASNLRG